MAENVPLNGEPKTPGDEKSLALGYGKWLATAKSDRGIEALERVAKLYRPVIMLAIIGAILAPIVAAIAWQLLYHR